MTSRDFLKKHYDHLTEDGGKIEITFQGLNEMLGLYAYEQEQEKIISSSPVLSNSLLAFLKWYRKQILAKGCNDEAVVEMYQASNV